MVSGESFRKLCNQVIIDEYGAVTYKEVALTLIPRTRNQARNATGCFEDFHNSFNHLMGDMINYIKQRFATFKEPPLRDFTVIDASCGQIIWLGLDKKR